MIVYSNSEIRILYRLKPLLQRTWMNLLEIKMSKSSKPSKVFQENEFPREFVLFFKQQQEHSQLLVHSPTMLATSRAGLQPKPGTGSQSRSPRGCQGPNYFSRHCCLLGFALAGVKIGKTNPNTPMWGVGVISYRPDTYS